MKNVFLVLVVLFLILVPARPAAAAPHPQVSCTTHSVPTWHNMVLISAPAGSTIWPHRSDIYLRPVDLVSSAPVGVLLDEGGMQARTSISFYAFIAPPGVAPSPTPLGFFDAAAAAIFATLNSWSAYSFVMLNVSTGDPNWGGHGGGSGGSGFGSDSLSVCIPSSATRTPTEQPDDSGTCVQDVIPGTNQTTYRIRVTEWFGSCRAVFDIAVTGTITSWVGTRVSSVPNAAPILTRFRYNGNPLYESFMNFSSSDASYPVAAGQSLEIIVNPQIDAVWTGVAVVVVSSAATPTATPSIPGTCGDGDFYCSHSGKGYTETLMELRVGGSEAGGFQEENYITSSHLAEPGAWRVKVWNCGSRSGSNQGLFLTIRAGADGATTTDLTNNIRLGSSELATDGFIFHVPIPGNRDFQDLDRYLILRLTTGSNWPAYAREDCNFSFTKLENNNFSGNTLTIYQGRQAWGGIAKFYTFPSASTNSTVELTWQFYADWVTIDPHGSPTTFCRSEPGAQTTLNAGNPFRTLALTGGAEFFCGGTNENRQAKLSVTISSYIAGPTNTPTASRTPTVTLTATASRTQTLTASIPLAATRTSTPSITLTATETVTVTASLTLTPTDTSTSTATLTASSTATLYPTYSGDCSWENNRDLACTQVAIGLTQIAPTTGGTSFVLPSVVLPTFTPSVRITADYMATIGVVKSREPFVSVGRAADFLGELSHIATQSSSASVANCVAENESLFGFVRSEWIRDPGAFGKGVTETFCWFVTTSTPVRTWMRLASAAICVYLLIRFLISTYEKLGDV